MNFWISRTSVSFQSRNEQFFVRSRKSRDSAGAYTGYVAQAISQIDTEIAEKGHLWMESRYWTNIVGSEPVTETIIPRGLALP